jgi:CubicO group peptidase (beta-lactamase class C family)
MRSPVAASQPSPVWARLTLVLLGIALGFAPPATAQEALPPGDPKNTLTENAESLDLATDDAPNIPNIDNALNEFVLRSEIAGAVTMIVDAERSLHIGATGFSHLGEPGGSKPIPMRVDSIFWIASMTKPVTAVCILQWVDQGKLSLDDPIDRFLPEMRALKNDAGEPVVITVKQLLNHTSGMRELKEPYAPKTLAEACELYAQAGVQFQPGSQWQYSQSSINTAARIVEVLSGMSFDAYAQQAVFGPLDMRNTGFYLSETQSKRLATSYTRTANGELEASPIFLLQGKRPTDRNRLPAANGGLFSTAEDYAKFCQMLLGGGVAQGQRILSAASVKNLRTPNTEDLVTGFTSGNAWGVGVCVVRRPQGVTAMLSSGTFGHGGAYGTQAWIDPVRGRAYLLMVQRANFPNADDSEVRKAFQRLATQIPDTPR